MNNDFAFLFIANDNDVELNEQDNNFIFSDNQDIETYIKLYYVKCIY